MMMKTGVHPVGCRVLDADYKGVSVHDAVPFPMCEVLSVLGDPGGRENERVPPAGIPTKVSGQSPSE